MRKIFIIVLASIYLTISTNLGFAAVSPGVGISTSNLLFYYDVNNPESYKGNNFLTNLANEGISHNALIVGSPTYSRTINGSFLTLAGGSGVAFDAVSSNQHLVLPTTNFDFSGGFSVSWYGSMGTVDNWERIFDFGNGFENGAFLLARQFNGSNYFYESWNSSRQSLGTCITGANTIPNTSALQQITLTISSSGACQFYINGVAVTSTKNNSTNILPVSTSRTTNFIGRSQWSGDNFLNGTLMRIAMYNKALSPAEVTQNYNSMVDVTYPSSISGGSASVSENATSGTTVSANEPSSYSIVTGGGSPDAARFNINQSTGVLTFKTAPNFESPNDADANNVYQIIVRAVDANGNHNDFVVQITVQNVAESATISTPSLSASAVKGTTLTITVSPSAGGTAGKITYFVNGKRIPNCISRVFSGSGTSTCSWKPATRGTRTISATFSPNGNEYAAATSSLQVFVNNRSNTR